MKFLFFTFSLLFALTSSARHYGHHSEPEYRIVYLDSDMAKEYRVTGTLQADCNYVSHGVSVVRLRGPLHLVELHVSSTRMICHDDKTTPVKVESRWIPVEEGQRLELILPRSLDLELQ